MITRKPCKCGCGKPPTMSFGGYNYLCVSQELRDAKTEKIKSQKKASIERQLSKNKVRSLSNNQDNDKAKRQVELNKWFDYVATVIRANPKCWNCGSYISESDYRSSSAHIMPKSIFHSIETHPLNFLVLSPRCCHDLSHRLDTFSKMKVWDMAVDRFLKFESEIEENHKLLNTFRELIKTK